LADRTQTVDEEQAEASTGHGAQGDRFGRRRGEIIAAAIPVLNRQGFKGMRLTAVAERIGLRATGVTYYFARKEELAVACIESGMAIFHDLLSIAEKERTAAARVSALVSAFVERDAAVRRGEATPLASFGSIRSLDDPHFARIAEGYKAMFRRARALFETPELSRLDKVARSIRAQIMLEQLYWSSAFLEDYEAEDFRRVAARMQDFMINGLAAPGQGFDPRSMRLTFGGEAGDGTKESFLMAAIRQINAHGYRGASVDRISASLNVTKGAFYHHNDAKDDLVATGFRRSFAVVRDAFEKAKGESASEWDRLTTATTALIRFQLSPDGPLMRTSVLASMPHEHQVEILNLSSKINRRVAGMISDAVAEGSARPVDAVIASQLLSASINAASDLRFWRNGGQNSDPLDYAAPIFSGLVK
jgi:AcrR family transcriptional regulator